MREITDDNGTIYSGDEDDMRIQYSKMCSEDENCEGDLSLQLL